MVCSYFIQTNQKKAILNETHTKISDLNFYQYNIDILKQHDLTIDFIEKVSKEYWDFDEDAFDSIKIDYISDANTLDGYSFLRDDLVDTDEIRYVEILENVDFNGQKYSVKNIYKIPFNTDSKLTYSHTSIRKRMMKTTLIRQQDKLQYHLSTELREIKPNIASDYDMYPNYYICNIDCQSFVKVADAPDSKYKNVFESNAVYINYWFTEMGIDDEQNLLQNKGLSHSYFDTSQFFADIEVILASKEYGLFKQKSNIKAIQFIGKNVKEDKIYIY